MSTREGENSSTSNTPGAPQSRNSPTAIEGLALEELLYSSSSFHAIVKPVTLTMILTALTVVYVNTPQSIAQGEAALSAYEAFGSGGSSDSNAQNLGISLVNALIIVSVICCMTFVIVLLYKYRCMKCLYGYMIFSSAMLLGMLGGLLFDTAIERYQLKVDTFSFIFALYNFAVVGTISIFFQKGVPMFVTQGYLIATSVILAWQLSHFNQWTAWALLFMLAIYDLCAVLTPCGPLRALVNLMSQDDSPDMPGLLYEASLPSEARRPGTRRRQREGQRQQQEESTNPSSPPEPVEPPSASSTESPVAGDNRETPGPTPDVREEGEVSPRTGMIPLALAKLYRLELVEPVTPTRRPSFTPLLEEDGNTEEENLTPNERLARQFTPEQLVTEVEAIFPRNGGSIERVVNADNEVRFVVKSRTGEVRKVLFVNDEGKVFEERRRADDDDDDRRKSNSIKLGLGDFIFYSVLVANAIEYSFATFAACMLVILAGLGGTLVLLAVYQHALPALPISIFLAIIFYFLTRVWIEPWIEAIFQLPFYV